jgi:DNA repair protein RadC
MNLLQCLAMKRLHTPLNAYPETLRPRERLRTNGVDALSDGELVALLLSTGTPQQTALDLARDVIEQAPSLPALARLPLPQLCRLPGMGVAKASRLLAAFELGRRSALQSLPEQPSLQRPDLVAAYLRPRFGDLNREHLIALFLDAKNRVNGHSIISIGTLTGTLVHPRDIFREALQHNAHSLLIAHNHPSGDPIPSSDDIHTTRRLIACGRLMQMEVLDHLVIGRHSHYSMREHLSLWSDHAG